MAQILRHTALHMLVLLLLFTKTAFAESNGVGCVQAYLDFHKLNPGPIDNALGSKTIKAAEDYRHKVEAALPELSKESVEIWCKHARDHGEFAALLSFDGISEPDRKSGNSKLDGTFLGNSVGKYQRAARNIKNPRALELLALDNGLTATRIAVNYRDKGHREDWSRNGKPGHAQRFELTEQHSFFMRPNKSYWYRMSVFIPKGTKINDHLTITDFKPQVRNVFMDPILDFKFGKNRLRIQHKFGHPYKCEFRRERGRDLTLCDETIEFNDIGSVTDLSGKWLHFVYRINWARNNSGTVHVWLNNKFILGLKGDTMLAGTRHIRNKFGVYRGYYLSQGTPQPDVSLYFAGIGRGRYCETLSLDNCDELRKDIHRFEKPGVLSTNLHTENNLSNR